MAKTHASVGRLGRAPSGIQLAELNVSQEELRRRRAEERKRELLALGRQGFSIGLLADYDWETYAPWVVRVEDQTVWARKEGAPPKGYRPDTHCVVVSDAGGWSYLTSSTATGPDAPRTVEELQRRKEQRERAIARRAQEAKTNLEAKRLTATPVTAADVEKGPSTLHEAVQQVLDAGGTLRVKAGTLVVALPAEGKAKNMLGEVGAELRAARVCYLAEEALVASLGKKSGEVDPSRVPDVAVLGSGKLEP